MKADLTVDEALKYVIYTVSGSRELTKHALTTLVEDMVAEIIDTKIKVDEVDKTSKPILRSVEESFGFGEVGGVVHTTEDTGYTYTDQDEENAAFEVSQHYLDKLRAEQRQRAKAELKKRGFSNGG